MHARDRSHHLHADNHLARLEADTSFDEGAQRIRIEVPNFYGKLDPYAFQDWITSLEDYFD